MSHSGLVIGHQLRKAREAAGLSLAAAASRANVSQDAIERWESDEVEPGLTELQACAKAYGRDVRFFLHETTESVPAFEFRTPTKRRFEELPADVRVVVTQFEELCYRAQRLQILLSEPRRIAVPQANDDERPEALAARLRSELGFTDKPIRKLREKITEELGVFVFELPIPFEEVSGLSSPNSALGPRILINARDRFGRRHFTLAHELAHLVYRHNASVCNVAARPAPQLPQPERIADRFAVEFLLPKESLKADFESRVPDMDSVGDLARLADRWRVSLEALGYRLEELKLLGRGKTQELLQRELPRVPIRGPARPSWERRLGRQYVNYAIRAHRRGLISLGKLASYLGVPYRKAFDLVGRSDSAG